ncbi:hypothetical protein [Nostoc sp.]|uniref:hypothetical protein n=1 Tax=Nostoc sp. TaxID=1180 RepID=UPI002FF6AD90
MVVCAIAILIYLSNQPFAIANSVSALLPALMPNDRPVLEKFQEYKKSAEFLMF